MYQRTDDFIANTLPAIIAGKKALTALFVTYKTVGRHPSGEVLSDKPGLKMVVKSGNHDTYSMQTITSLTLGLFPGNKVSRAMGDSLFKAEGHAAMSKLRASLNDLEPETSGQVLVILYAGLSAFDEAVDYAKELRTRFSNLTIVVVTCDCDVNGKMKKLQPLLNNHSIDHVAVTHRCGGQMEMGEILDSLAEQWPAAS